MARKTSKSATNKRKDGLLQKCFRYGGKRYVVYGHNDDELYEKKIAKIQELQSGLDRRINPTMQQYFDTWLNRKRAKVTEATIRRHTHMFKAIAETYIPNAARTFGELNIKDVTLDDLLTVQSHLLESHQTRGVNDSMSLIKNLLKTATNERIIDYNPSVLVESLKRTEPQARDTNHRALSLEEQRVFFDSQAVKDSSYYDVFRLAILTGLRIGEIGALTNADIHGGYIHVSRTLTRTEDGGYRLGDQAKTNAGKRDIPLTEEMRSVIKHRKELNKILGGGIESIDGVIFKSPRGGYLISWGINKEIRRLCASLSIEPFTIHALRATFATRMVQAGVNPKTLQELMGHADIDVTMNIYAHSQANDKIDAMRRVNIAI